MLNWGQPLSMESLSQKSWRTFLSFFVCISCICATLSKANSSATGAHLHARAPRQVACKTTPEITPKELCTSSLASRWWSVTAYHWCSVRRKKESLSLLAVQSLPIGFSLYNSYPQSVYIVLYLFLINQMCLSSSLSGLRCCKQLREGSSKTKRNKDRWPQKSWD